MKQCWLAQLEGLRELFLFPSVYVNVLSMRYQIPHGIMPGKMNNDNNARVSCIIFCFN